MGCIFRILIIVFSFFVCLFFEVLFRKFERFEFKEFMLSVLRVVVVDGLLKFMVGMEG